ncbi:restriction endonuclease subunit S [candidate division WWE3 bacterium]|nr:restriction endonuclease subunit S [candidate division WWE3 bacterium]
MKYSQYPRYKDSGVEWLGQIPCDWQMIRGKFLFDNKKELNTLLKCDTRLSLTLNGVLERSKTSAEGLQPEKFDTYQIFNEGDLVFKLIDLENKQTSRVGYVHKKGIMSSAYIRLEGKPAIDIRFAYHSFFRLYIEYIFNSLGGNGVRSALNGSDLLEVPVQVPSMPEQLIIAKFLDKATSKIDTLISKQTRLIELLKEKRQAVIKTAVTRGLDNSVLMKDSGVEWLGEVPAHWKITPLRHIGRLQNGISKGGDYFGSGFPFVNYGDIYNNGALPLSVEGLANSSVQDRIMYSVKKGDVFFTRTSETIDDIGLAATCVRTIVNATFSGFTIRFRQLKRVLIEDFSKYSFRTGDAQAFFEKQLNLVTRASLGQDILKQLPVLLPPMEEQQRIALYLDDKTAKIDKLESNASAAITLLKEKRNALISSAVTGKIDVRGAV